MENIQDYVKDGRQRFGKRDSCSRGHAFTPENTRLTPQMKFGKQYFVRVCKTCARGYLRVRQMGWSVQDAFWLPPTETGGRLHKRFKQQLGVLETGGENP